MACSKTAFIEFEDCKSSYLFEVGLTPNQEYTYVITDKFGNVYSKVIQTDEDGYFSILPTDFPPYFFTSASGNFTLFLKENIDDCEQIDFEYCEDDYDTIIFSFKPNTTGSESIVVDKCQKVLDCLGISDSGDENKYLNEQGEFVEIIINQPTLNEVLAEDNETDGQDILISDGDQIQFDNYARIRKGATDAGLGGQKGVALVCSIDYELKWEAGRQYVMQQDGFTIREVSHNFTITPTVNDDDTKGFAVGSRWILDDGTVYVCSDSTTGAAVWAAITNGTVTSVGLTMPSAFSVANSPITSSGDIAVTGAGLISQYVRGDGSLANFPASTGGGASQSFYLNGSVSQGTFGGVAFKEMDRTPILGAGTDFTINTNGYIQSFITDAGVPNLLEIPAGNWTFETYFSASSGGGSPSFYVELYKWNGTTLSLIASNSATPEGITNGTVTDLYISALAVPQTALLATDRLAVRIYVNNSSRTIKLHTENNHLSQIITTFSTGITALNGLTDQVQNLSVGTSGTDFAISSATATHTFNLPTASASNRGALSSADWTAFDGAVTWIANNGGYVNKERRHDWQTPYSYNGSAANGTAESANGWTVVRIEVFANGTTNVMSATGSWDNRITLIYT